ncbi:MAG: SxtJ family membrane protein [Syntrophorhabdaceae bacterium]|nr:SxtJ family membrane protein [Syntrophorhabdaceae bacterium]
MIPDVKQGRFKGLQTVCTLSFVAIIVGLVFKLKIFLYISFILLFIGLFTQKPSEAISKAWLKFANTIGIINTKIILTLIFYCFLTPIAFFYRLTHGDFMNLKRNPEKRSLYEIRDHEYTPEDLEKLW